MKTLAILTIAVTAAAGAAYADTVYLTRAYAEPGRLMTDLAAYDFDVDGAVPGDHFDLYASADDLAVLGLKGISYDVLDEIDTSDAPPSEYTEYAELVPILQGLRIRTRTSANSTTSAIPGRTARSGRLKFRTTSQRTRRQKRISS